MSQLRIAIQGEPGSFSAAATSLLLGDQLVEQKSCRHFGEVFELLNRGDVDRAVVPLENSLAGSVHQNYDLVREHRAWISAEVFVHVEHCLIGTSSSRIGGIDTVLSHPVALEQCRGFLDQHANWQVRREQDTSGSVRTIIECGDNNLAAIASAQAAEVYGGRVLARAIQDNENNYTRFVMLSKAREVAASANKVSILFSFKNLPGALHKALSVFALRDIDLTKIESRPQPGEIWKYIFYIDFLGRLDEERVQNALNHLGEVTDLLEVLGCYRADESIRRQFL